MHPLERLEVLAIPDHRPMAPNALRVSHGFILSRPIGSSVRHRLARWNNVSVESIIQRALAGDDLASLMDECQRQGGASLSETSDRLMVAIAERFLDGRLSYTDADRVANGWWALMCRPDYLQAKPIPALAQTIFEAFDQGEYSRGDQLDPVQQFTIPLLRSALNDPTAGGGE